jgi:hypothetical protein
MAVLPDNARAAIGSDVAGRWPDAPQHCASAPPRRRAPTPVPPAAGDPAVRFARDQVRA